MLIRRALFLAVFVVGLIALHPSRVAAQGCGDCAPDMLSNRGYLPTHAVLCFHDQNAEGLSFASNDSDIEQFMSGVNYWNGMFDTIGVDQDFSYEHKGYNDSCSSGTIEVKLSYVAGGLPAETVQGPSTPMHININPSTWASNSDSRGFWGAHETGHMLGFGEAPEDCADETVMEWDYSLDFVPDPQWETDNCMGFALFDPNPNYNDDEIAGSTNGCDLWQHVEYIYTYHPENGGYWEIQRNVLDWWWDCNPY